MKVLKKVLLASLIISLLPAQDVKAEQAARPVPEYLTPPINPFDAQGYCFHSDCPQLHLGAQIIALTTNPTWPMQGTVPSYIPLIFLAIDNAGYSNWWKANATLVSANGTRIPLGAGVPDDGNDWEDIGLRCNPLYDINPCSPFISWSNPTIPVTAPVGTYALEISFYLYDGRYDGTYTFGPNFMAITGQILPDSLQGKRCTNPGAITNKDGARFACVKRKKGTVWRQI